MVGGRTARALYCTVPASNSTALWKNRRKRRRGSYSKRRGFAERVFLLPRFFVLASGTLQGSYLPLYCNRRNYSELQYLTYTAHVKVPFVGFNVHIVERTLNTHKRAKYGGYETHLFSLRPNAMSAEGQRYDFRQRTRRRTKTLIKEYRRCGVVPP